MSKSHCKPFAARFQKPCALPPPEHLDVTLSTISLDERVHLALTHMIAICKYRHNIRHFFATTEHHSIVVVQVYIFHILNAYVLISDWRLY